MPRRKEKCVYVMPRRKKECMYICVRIRALDERSRPKTPRWRFWEDAASALALVSELNRDTCTIAPEGTPTYGRWGESAYGRVSLQETSITHRHDKLRQIAANVHRHLRRTGVSDYELLVHNRTKTPEWMNCALNASLFQGDLVGVCHPEERT